MSRKVDERIGAELARAEAEGSCLVPATRADRAALMRRVRRRRTADEDRIISPAPAIYARWAHWRSLKPPQRALGIIRGLAALHPDWVFCGPSAALVRGISVSWASLRRTHVVCGSRDGKRLAARIVRHQIDPGDVEVVSGVRVTSLARTAFDCMRDASFPDALAVADSVLRLSGMSRGALRRPAAAPLLLGSPRHRAHACHLRLGRPPRGERRGVRGPGHHDRARRRSRPSRSALPTRLRRTAGSGLTSHGSVRTGGPSRGSSTAWSSTSTPRLWAASTSWRSSPASAVARLASRPTTCAWRASRSVRWRARRASGAGCASTASPSGPPPERRHGVPVRARAGGWSPSCGAGKMSLGGWRLEYQVVAA